MTHHTCLFGPPLCKNWAGINKALCGIYIIHLEYTLCQCQRCLESRTFTLSRAFWEFQRPVTPPRRHSSPLIFSLPFAASPIMISRSRFCELSQLRTKLAGSSLSEVKKECFALETEMACMSLANWSSSAVTSLSMLA